ncbi:hypothetical protein EDB81DRAFT_885511 [Dactylonectria macrodidyma]|uniref:Uncharacterized protein n=1 Tax=Dactylonectria macrodidyma TaxID=307937 RepID=A0A9P9ENC0_9HYPO|nr:hypothetical protein EDB81DRAFT_885511 [Dactylonectria macrodidyma]
MGAPTVLALIVGFAALPVYYAWLIISNYEIAKQTGLRTIIAPGNLMNPAEGIDWQRHSRPTAGSFNELTNNMVWAESLRQSRQLQEHCLACGDGTNVIADISWQFAPKVLMRASFGKEYDFKFPSDPQDSAETGQFTSLSSRKGAEVMDYYETLQLILKNCTLSAFFDPDYWRNGAVINR